MLATLRVGLGKSGYRCMSSIVEKQIKVGNTSINYVTAGKETSSRHVFLMPGALGSAWTDFRPQLNGLGVTLPDYKIVAWDPPGYGKSSGERTYTADFFEKDAEAAYNFMLTSHPTSEPYDVLGWSDGGITAFILAAKYPKAVRKVVAWGSNAYIHPKEIEIYESIRDVKKWSQKMREPMEKMYGVEGFPILWNKWIDGMLKIFKERKGDICSDSLKDIAAETLIVHGRKDPMILPEHVPFLLKHIPKSKLYEFPDGKHNIHLRYPDEFNKIVSDFLLA